MQIFTPTGVKSLIVYGFEFCTSRLRSSLPSPGETVVLLERDELGGAVPGTTVLNGKSVRQLLKVSAGRGGGWWLQNGT